MTTDDSLILKAKTGDYEAFEELVCLHRKRVYAIAHGILHDHFDADDITQETFVKVYQNLHQFKAESRFSTWLYRIVVNLSLNRLKSRDSRLVQLEEISDRAHGRTPAHIVAEDELNAVVKKAIGSLPNDQKAVIVLREFEGMSHKDIADVMGCTEGTVWSRLHRARQKLKKVLTLYLEG